MKPTLEDSILSIHPFAWLWLAVAFLIAVSACTAAQPSVATAVPSSPPAQESPPPTVPQPTPNPDPDRAFCEEFFSGLQSSSGENHERVLANIERCVQDRTTPAWARPSRTPTPTQDWYHFQPYERPVENGKIVEAGGFRIPFRFSHYYFSNQWIGEVNGERWTALAGHKRISYEPNIQWHGVLDFCLIDENDQIIEGRGEFVAPEGVEVLRIVDLQGTELVMVGSGYLVRFDLGTMQYTSVEKDAAFSRPAGNGTIVESHDMPYQMDDYVFLNYWIGRTAHKTTVVMAGYDPNEYYLGIIVVAVAPTENMEKPLEVTIYAVPNTSSFRIVNARSQNLTFITGDYSQVIYMLAVGDKAARVLDTSHSDLPDEYSIVSVVPVSACGSNCPTIMLDPCKVYAVCTPLPTRTPTLTPSPQPTITKFPTIHISYKTATPTPYP